MKRRTLKVTLEHPDDDAQLDELAAALHNAIDHMTAHAWGPALGVTITVLTDYDEAVTS